MCWYWCFWLPGARRGVSTSKLGVSYAATRPLLLAGATLAGAVSIYSYTKHKSLLQLPLPVTYAASTPAHQDNVTSFILVICTTSTAHFNYITCEISIIKNNEMSDFQSQPPPDSYKEWYPYCPSFSKWSPFHWLSRENGPFLWQNIDFKL